MKVVRDDEHPTASGARSACTTRSPKSDAEDREKDGTKHAPRPAPDRIALEVARRLPPPDVMTSSRAGILIRRRPLLPGVPRKADDLVDDGVDARSSVSTTVASLAGMQGAIARDESARSRRSMSRSTDSKLSSRPSVLDLLRRRRARSSALAFR